MDNKEIGNRINSARLRLNLTLQDVADKVGVASSTIHRYETGAVNKIKLPVIESIANALNVSPAWLVGKVDNSLPIDAIPYMPGKRIPILGVVPAGYPIMAIEDIEGYDYADVANPEEYFFLRVRGDSMINIGIYSGDLALIKKQSCAENGQIVVCRVNGDEATLKRFHRESDVVLLQPENPAYQPIIVPYTDFNNGYAAILGVLKEIKRKF